MQTVNIKNIISQIRAKTSFKPDIGIVLGSGLSGLSQEITVTDRISYSELEGFPRSTVEGHKGEYIFGYIGKTAVVLMNGRVHYYEGYTMQQVVAPVRIMASLGANTIILTNAAGGLNESFHPGTLMCIKDQIATFVPSPLIGPNDSDLGPRFPEMSKVYDPQLISLLHRTAEQENIPLVDGVYMQITGPAYETPAESRMYASWGADAVGMSTACEAVALRHMGVKLLGLSCVTDMAINNENTTTTHEQVQKVAREASRKLITLVKGTVQQLGSI